MNDRESDEWRDQATVTQSRKLNPEKEREREREND